jgi:hypothetical protein
MVLNACSEPLEFPDWTIPVPEGTPIVEHGGVTISGRSDRIELVEDLVVGAEESDDEVIIYSPFDVAVDESGRMFVVDGASDNVHMFAPDGTHIRSIGRRGEGPGEFPGLGRLTVAADRLVVMALARFSFWSLEGEFLEEHHPQSPVDAWRLEGLTDGSFVGMNRGRGQHRVSRFDAHGELLNHLVELSFEPDWVPRGKGLPFDRNVRFATAPDGSVYVMDGIHYQIVTLDPSGTVLRALRVDWTPKPYTAEDFDAYLDQLPERFDRNRIVRPDSWPALADLRVDGHGHLYVFPSGHLVYDREVKEWPVDVYSAEGEPLFSGTMDRFLWNAYLGDYVYGISPDPVSEENRVVRYRLVEPFA